MLFYVNKTSATFGFFETPYDFVPMVPEAACTEARLSGMPGLGSYYINTLEFAALPELIAFIGGMSHQILLSPTSGYSTLDGNPIPKLQILDGGTRAVRREAERANNP